MMQQDKKVEMNAEGSAIKEMSKTFIKCSNDISIDRFVYAPFGYRVVFPTGIIVIIVSYILAFFMPFVSLLLNLLCFAAIVSEYILNLRLSDYFFKEEICCNMLINVHSATKATKKVFICCDIDDKRFGLGKVFGKLASKIVTLIDFIGILYFFAFTLLSLLINGFGIGLPGKFTTVLGLIGLVFLPTLITKLVALFMKFDEVNYNTTRVEYLQKVCEEVYKTKTAFTDVSIFVAGGKSSGIRGQKAFVEEKKDSYAEYNELYFINIEDEVIGAPSVKITMPKNDEEVSTLEESLNSEAVEGVIKKSQLINTHTLELQKIPKAKIFSLYNNNLSVEKNESDNLARGLTAFIRAIDKN